MRGQSSANDSHEEMDAPAWPEEESEEETARCDDHHSYDNEKTLTGSCRLLACLLRGVTRRHRHTQKHLSSVVLPFDIAAHYQTPAVHLDGKGQGSAHFVAC